MIYILCLLFVCFGKVYSEELTEDKVWQLVAKKYCIPNDHPMKPVLDALFADRGVIENTETLQAAGFSILFSQESSFIKVVQHPLLPGYLIKLYPDSEKRIKSNILGSIWLTRRCIGAERIRKLIAKKQLRHFIVPDKWLYELPNQEPDRQPYILLVDDMQLVNYSDCLDAWYHTVTTEHLNELFCLLQHGCGSNFLVANIPYTKTGKFACIDTEYPRRKINLEKVKRYLSPAMQAYWDQLMMIDNSVK